MDTRKLTKEYRLAFWTQLARERAESGRNVRAFCEERGLHENTYYYWQRKLREATYSAAAPAGGGAAENRARSERMGGGSGNRAGGAARGNCAGTADSFNRTRRIAAQH
jgi:transposase-like protein